MTNKKPDFSHPADCAAVLATINEHTAKFNAELRAAFASASDPAYLARMDWHLNKMREALHPIRQRVLELHDERMQIVGQDNRKTRKAVADSAAEQIHFAAYAAGELPEIPPSHFAVYLVSKGKINIYGMEDWKYALSIKDDRIYDISLIGHDWRKYNWTMGENESLIAKKPTEEATGG